MNDNPPMSRARYLRTLRRFCGPVMGWRVVNAANTNNRTAPLSRACAAEAGSDPRPASNLSAGDA